MLEFSSNPCAARQNENVRLRKMFANTHMRAHAVAFLYVCERFRG